MKNENDLEIFLIAIDATPEYIIREVMKDEYIDTPGYWSQEKDDYSDIFEFMQANMGQKEFTRLVEWHSENPTKVAQLI
jgi:hypothetical protein